MDINNIKQTLKSNIESSSIEKKLKKHLIEAIDTEDYRDKLSRGFSKALFQARDKSNSSNNELHDDLSFIHKEVKFLNNCINISKKL